MKLLERLGFVEIRIGRKTSKEYISRSKLLLALFLSSGYGTGIVIQYANKSET